MKRVRDIVGRDVIDDLWGAGYTILPRNRHPDPFFVPPEMVPATRSYRWWHLVHDKFHFERLPGNSSGWSPVPASRHDGYFMPAGHVGDIEVSGLGLFEKSKVEVDAERAANHTKAQQQVADWVEKTGAQFSGSVSVGDVGTEVGDAEVGKSLFPDTKTIETTVRLPADMLPHMAEVFAERDRLANLAVMCLENGTGCSEVDVAVVAYRHEIEDNQNLARWPALHALVLPLAVKNVRKQIKEKLP